LVAQDEEDLALLTRLLEGCLKPIVEQLQRLADAQEVANQRIKEAVEKF